jgi:hypothetical protein
VLGFAANPAPWFSRKQDSRKALGGRQSLAPGNILTTAIEAQKVRQANSDRMRRDGSIGNPEISVLQENAVEVTPANITGILRLDGEFQEGRANLSKFRA